MESDINALNKPVEELGTMTVVPRRPQLVIRERPTAEVYDLAAILARQTRPAGLDNAPETTRPSASLAKFKRPDRDPFLRRLARLT